jgi:hypothetical protein
MESKINSNWILFVVLNIPLYWLLVRILFGGMSDFGFELKNFIATLFLPTGNGFDCLLTGLKIIMICIISIMAIGGEQSVLGDQHIIPFDDHGHITIVKPVPK